MKQLQKITAYNWKKGQRVDLEYHSILHKCKCQKHYDEQFIAEWYDEKGHNKIIRDIEDVGNIIPLGGK